MHTRILNTQHAVTYTNAILSMRQFNYVIECNGNDGGGAKAHKIQNRKLLSINSPFVHTTQAQRTKCRSQCSRMWANERRSSRCELRELCNFREGKFYGYKHSMHVMCSTLVWFDSIRFDSWCSTFPIRESVNASQFTAMRMARQHIFNVILYAANKSLSRHRWLSRNQFSLPVFILTVSFASSVCVRADTWNYWCSRFWPDAMGIEDMDRFVSWKMWQKRC